MTDIFRLLTVLKASIKANRSLLALEEFLSPDLPKGLTCNTVVLSFIVWQQQEANWRLRENDLIKTDKSHAIMFLWLYLTLQHKRLVLCQFWKGGCGNYVCVWKSWAAFPVYLVFWVSNNTLDAWPFSLALYFYILTFSPLMDQKALLI